MKSTLDFNSRSKRFTPSDEWLTPPWIVNALRQAGAAFALDPCAAVRQPWATARTQYTVAEDGLAHDWGTSNDMIWLNSPYGGDAIHWVQRLAQHSNGIALLFSRTETTMFQKHVFPHISGLLFVGKRLKFWEQTCALCTLPASQHHDPQVCTFTPSGRAVEGGSANAPSVLLAYGKDAAEILRYATAIPGRFSYFRDEVRNLAQMGGHP